MAKIAFTLFCTFAFISFTSAKNDSKPFVLIIPDVTIEQKLYDNLVYLDSREDTTNMGFIQTGMFNKYRLVKDEISFDKQIDSLLHSVNAETTSNKTLMFQLRTLMFSEVTKSTSEHGYCHLRIDLYEKDPLKDAYYPISQLDTLVSVKAMDVTGKLLKTSSEVITNFVIVNLNKSTTEAHSYSFNDLVNIDEIEKSKFGLYNKDVLVDGIYENFSSFLNQSPADIEFEFKFGEYQALEEVKMKKNHSTKFSKLKPSSVYAVVADGIPHITTNKSYIRIHKKDGDFKFLNDGSVKLDASRSSVNVASTVLFGMLGGIVGAAVATGLDSSGSGERIILTLDHKNGQFYLSPKDRKEKK